MEGTTSARPAASSGARAINRCVLFERRGAECATPWYSDLTTAQRAVQVLRRRYGAAVLYRN